MPRQGYRLEGNTSIRDVMRYIKSSVDATPQEGVALLLINNINADINDKESLVKKLSGSNAKKTFDKFSQAVNNTGFCQGMNPEVLRNYNKIASDFGAREIFVGKQAAPASAAAAGMAQGGGPVVPPEEQAPVFQYGEWDAGFREKILYGEGIPGGSMLGGAR